MSAARATSRSTHNATATRAVAEHLVLSALLYWPYTPDVDCLSVMLVSPSGNGKSHLVRRVLRSARVAVREGPTTLPQESEKPALAPVRSTTTNVAVVSPSLADALASQQRDGSTSLRAVLRRAVLSAVKHTRVPDSKGRGVASQPPTQWSVLVHVDHTEHFLSADGSAASAGYGGGDRGEDGADDGGGGDANGDGGLSAFSAYPTLLADLYAVRLGCPALFTHDECQALHLARLVFVFSFSSDHGEATLHPFARARLFDAVFVLDTPTERERRTFFECLLGRRHRDASPRLFPEPSPAALDALAQRTGGVTCAGLLEVADLWCQQHEEKTSAASVLAQRVVTQFRRSCTVAAQQWCRSAGYVDVQATSWSDIAGMDAVKTQLQDMVTRPLKFCAQYQQRGVRHSTGVLLHGPPGTGKTMLAKAMATELNASFIYIDLPELVQAEVGESERKLKAFFETACQRSPAVIFMDELQAAFGVRYLDSGEKATQVAAGSSHDARLVSQLLQLLDAAQEDTSHLIVFVGATNVVHLLDPLLLRPGRLDTHLAVPLPDESARESLARRVVEGEWESWFAEVPPKARLRVQTALVGLFVAASREMSGAALRNAMSVFALKLVQACLPDAPVEAVRRAEAQDDAAAVGIVGATLLAFLCRDTVEERSQYPQEEAIKDVLSEAALALARDAFAAGES